MIVLVLHGTQAAEPSQHAAFSIYDSWDAMLGWPPDIVFSSQYPQAAVLPFLPTMETVVFIQCGVLVFGARSRGLLFHEILIQDIQALAHGIIVTPRQFTFVEALLR